MRVSRLIAGGYRTNRCNFVYSEGARELAEGSELW